MGRLITTEEDEFAFILFSSCAFTRAGDAYAFMEDAFPNKQQKSRPITAYIWPTSIKDICHCVSKCIIKRKLKKKKSRFLFGPWPCFGNMSSCRNPLLWLIHWCFFKTSSIQIVPVLSLDMLVYWKKKNCTGGVSQHFYTICRREMDRNILSNFVLFFFCLWSHRDKSEA